VVAAFIPGGEVEVLGSKVRINVPTTAAIAQIISNANIVLTHLLFGYLKEIISGIILVSIITS
jgi:hypothetical protein